MPKEKINACFGKNNISDFIINFASSSDNCIAGMVEHCQSGSVQYFKSFSEIALLVNKKLDEVHFPESANEIRVWADKDTPLITWEAGCMNIEEINGPIPNQPETSFLIKIHFRQNSDWQGSIQWLDGRKSKRFRSFLEMVVLMQEALSLSDKAGNTIKFQTWEDKEEVL